MRLAAVDATTSSKGGVAYELPGDPVDDEGTWITLKRDSVSLRGGQTINVPFTVDIPADTEPGVHLAGLAISPPTKPTPKASPTSGGAVIDLQSRFIVAVQVNLPGGSIPELVIAGVEPVIATSGVTLEVLVENVGFGFGEGEGSLELPGEGFEEALPFGKVVPGTTMRYPVPWEKDPAEGEYEAQVSLTYSEQDPELLTGRASWEGTFLIGEVAVGELDRLQGAEDFNWLLVIAPTLIVLLFIAFLVWRRRRGPTLAPAASAPAKQQAAQPHTQPQGGGYTGTAGGTFGGATARQKQPAPQTPQQRPSGTPPPPPPPPPKQGP